MTVTSRPPLGQPLARPRRRARRAPRAAVSARVARRLFAAAVNRLDVTVAPRRRDRSAGAGPAMTVQPARRVLRPDRPATS